MALLFSSDLVVSYNLLTVVGIYLVAADFLCFIIHWLNPSSFFIPMFIAVILNIKSRIVVFYINISFTIIQNFNIKKMDITIIKCIIRRCFILSFLIITKVLSTYLRLNFSTPVSINSFQSHFQIQLE